jgi:saccharopine dehydrogenase-like NADP-dependent oxidoreductase
VPPVAAAMLIAKGKWNVKTMVNVEELNPEPCIELLAKMGLPTQIKKIKRSSPSKQKTTKAIKKIKNPTVQP